MGRTFLDQRLEAQYCEKSPEKSGLQPYSTDSPSRSSQAHISIIRGLPFVSIEYGSRRLKFTSEPSLFVNGDLAELMKRRASEWPAESVPYWF